MSEKECSLCLGTERIHSKLSQEACDGTKSCSNCHPCEKCAPPASVDNMALQKSDDLLTALPIPPVTARPLPNSLPSNSLSPSKTSISASGDNLNNSGLIPLRDAPRSGRKKIGSMIISTGADALQKSNNAHDIPSVKGLLSSARRRRAATEDKTPISPKANPPLPEKFRAATENPRTTTNRPHTALSNEALEEEEPLEKKGLLLGSRTNLNEEANRGSPDKVVDDPLNSAPIRRGNRSESINILTDKKVKNTNENVVENKEQVTDYLLDGSASKNLVGVSLVPGGSDQPESPSSLEDEIEKPSSNAATEVKSVGLNAYADRSPEMNIHSRKNSDASTATSKGKNRSTFSKSIDHLFNNGSAKKKSTLGFEIKGVGVEFNAATSLPKVSSPDNKEGSDGNGAKTVASPISHKAADMLSHILKDSRHPSNTASVPNPMAASNTSPIKSPIIPFRDWYYKFSNGKT